MAETITRGRKAKHIDHYICTRHIGTRSMVIRLNGNDNKGQKGQTDWSLYMYKTYWNKINGDQIKWKDFQRDAGMIMLEKPKGADEDPTIRNRIIIATQAHNNTLRVTHPLQIWWPVHWLISSNWGIGCLGGTVHLILPWMSWIDTMSVECRVMLGRPEMIVSEAGVYGSEGLCVSYLERQSNSPVQPQRTEATQRTKNKQSGEASWLKEVWKVEE